MTAAPTPGSWRHLALPVYGPTLLVSVGYGAILPLVALSARALDASVGMAAHVVGLIGLGQLVGDLPAGALAEGRPRIAAAPRQGAVGAGRPSTGAADPGHRRPGDLRRAGDAAVHRAAVG